MFGSAPVMTKTWRISSRLDLAAALVAPGDALEAVAPLHGNDLGLGAKLDLRFFLDAPDQIAGHGFAESVGTDEHVNALGVAARKTAAWPAELPPPMTTISSPAQSCDSMTVAP